jgi:hypothetical protein
MAVFILEPNEGEGRNREFLEAGILWMKKFKST